MSSKTEGVGNQKSEIRNQKIRRNQGQNDLTVASVIVRSLEMASSLAQALARLTPLKRIALVMAPTAPVSLTPVPVGVSVSDPYLSHAVPATLDPRGVTNAGAVVPADVELLLTMTDESDSVIAKFTSDRNIKTITLPRPDLTLADCKKQMEKNPLWDQTGILDAIVSCNPKTMEELFEGRPNVASAVYLQKIIDDVGGWDNTFG